MKDSLLCKRLEVRKSAVHGYGVYALEPISEGETIEECYFVETKNNCSILHDYYFGVDNKTVIVLGYGSIYNHANSPNADMVFPIDENHVRIDAIKDIKKDEEIFIYYGPQWFKQRRFNYVDNNGILKNRRIANIFLRLSRFLIITGFIFLTLNFINYLK